MGIHDGADGTYIVHEMIRTIRMLPAMRLDAIVLDHFILREDVVLGVCVRKRELSDIWHRPQVSALPDEGLRSHRSFAARCLCHR